MTEAEVHVETVRRPRRRSIDISVVAPCYNEMENANALTERLLHLFAKRKLHGEVVLVNDGSRDETGRVIDELARKYPDSVVAVHHKKNQGIAVAWQTGVDSSSGKYVCLIDADLQYLPEEVWRLYREIEASRADMVQGFRSTIERLKDSRYLYSKALNVLLNVSFGMNLQDNKSGFVIARRDTLFDILQHRFKYHYFNTFIAVAAACKGYSIKEVETLFKNRNLGQSYIQGFPLKLIWRVLVDIVKAFFEYNLLSSSLTDALETFVASHPVKRNVERYRGWRRLWLDAFFATMPLHKWKITRNGRRHYELLNISQWYEPAELRELQEVRLQHLVRHAYLHVPYYADQMQAAGLTPEDIHTLDDLQKLPMLTKASLRENLYFDLFADNHRKKEMLKIATSGSTGEPLVLYADRRQLEMRWASTFRSAEWTGWRFGDRQARLWHQTLGMSKTQVVREFLDAWFMRRLFIPAYEMSDDNIRELIEKLRRFKPVLIDGYAEIFNFLAHYARKNGIKGLEPKAIMTSAQIMPPQVREVIEREFKTSVFDKYGSREFSGIAYECDHHQGHHIMAESYIVEILKDGRPAKPGELGEIVITDLNNFAVPLIRYRIGDLAVAMNPDDVCTCGRGLPRIGRIEGRSQAIVLCANGTWLPGTFFAHFFKDYEFAVRQYQIVQRVKDAIDLKIVPENGYSATAENEILTGLKRYMGDSMGINVQLVDQIPLLRTGKRTGVVSHLDYDFQRLADAPSGTPSPE
ncbi:MAG TPA: glycosyltransferase [Thermoanaerobaculia bacterium]|nr:glycosyltransferase [Thermoanaerobaculia bacterium]